MDPDNLTNEDDEDLQAPTELEHFFSCPHCGAQISVLLDTSVSNQAFVEDCEVCCNPIQISYRVDGHIVTSFQAHAET